METKLCNEKCTLSKAFPCGKVGVPLCLAVGISIEDPGHGIYRCADVATNTKGERW